LEGSEESLPASLEGRPSRPEEVEVDLGGGDDTGESPREALEAAEKALKHAEDKYLRALADLDNLRKRLSREKTEWLTYGQEGVVKDFLPIVDNLERAVSAATRGAGGDDSLLEGVELTLRQFREALARHGVTPIESEGQPFDPTLHEALMRVERADLPPGTVVTEFRKGYRLRDRLLRPAQVSVSAEPGPGHENDGEEPG
jgi:molecular chaperone GrpE